MSLESGPSLVKMRKVENVREASRPKEVAMSRDLKFIRKPDTRNVNSRINFVKTLKIFISTFFLINNELI